MRLRIWLAIGLLVCAVALAGCSIGRVARAPAGTPVPTKTLRPTFTHTPAKPVPAAPATPVPPAATAVVITASAPAATADSAPAPTDTPVPPSPTLSPTPASASLTVASDTVNVRGGPGTNYAVLGRLQQGQTFPITGKNAAGDWWEFDYSGRTGWVFGQNVRVTSPDLVQVAANIPAAPTARPVPTRAPQRAAPTARPQPQPQPPAPAPVTVFVQAGAELRNADDANFQWVTFWGRVGKVSEPPPSGYRLRVNAPSGTRRGAH